MNNLKKRISILLAIVILITSLIVPVTANETGSSDGAFISTGDKLYPVTMGDTYTYEYRLNLGKKLTALDASLSYDTEGLELVNYTFPILGSSANAGTYGGKLYFNYSSATGTAFSSDSAVLIRATFKVKSASGTFDVHTDITDMARYQEVKIVENGAVLSSFTHRELITDDDSTTSIYIKTGNKYYKVKRGKTYNYICYLKTNELVGNLAANTYYDSYGLSTSSSTRTTYQSYSGKSFAADDTVLVSIPFTVKANAYDNSTYSISTSISKLQDINEDTISRYTLTEVIEGLPYVTRDPNEPPTEAPPETTPPEPTVAPECNHWYWGTYTANENYRYYSWGYTYDIITYCSHCGQELSRDNVTAPIEPTEPAIEPTVPPYPDDPSDYIYINADGNIYQVEAGSDHTYEYCLNVGGTVCGIDARTTWDAPEISILDGPYFPELGDVVYNQSNINDNSWWNQSLSGQQIRFNYTDTDGTDFNSDDSVVISFTIHISEDVPPGVYCIHTDINVLEGEEEERIIFEGTDLTPERLYLREGIIDGHPGDKESTYYTADEQTYMTYSFEDKTFTVNADHRDDRTYDKFRALYLDGQLVDYNNYTKESGSLKLTLKPEFMETLSFGYHELRFVFSDGEAYGAIHVVQGAQPASEYTSPTTPTDNPNYPYYNDGLIRFDAASAGWQNASCILFYIRDLEYGELAAWGSKKKLGGTKGANNIWSFDAAGLGVVPGRQYSIIFNNYDTKAETYPLLMDTSCFGDTAYAIPYKRIENPVDSNKTSMEARWGRSSLGPQLQITSIGNVVGETCPSNTTPYQMLVNFLKNTLPNARQYSGKSDQQIVDDTANALGLSSDDISRAISESGVSVNWDPPYVAPTEPPADNYGYIVGAYYLTGSINGDNSGTSNVHKGLKFKDNTSDSMLLDNVRLKRGDVVRVARYNGGNTFTIYPDGVGRDITIDASGRYDFYFKPYELGNANYWYVTPSYLGEVAPFILGDADGNEEIESVDATFIQRWLAKIDTPYTKAELMRGDVDGSGDLELTDVTAIQYYLCHLKTLFPIGQNIT